jgi:hypothetical protein
MDDIDPDHFGSEGHICLGNPGDQTGKELIPGARQQEQKAIRLATREVGCGDVSGKSNLFNGLVDARDSVPAHAGPVVQNPVHGGKADTCRYRQIFRRWPHRQTRPIQESGFAENPWACNENEAGTSEIPCLEVRTSNRLDHGQSRGEEAATCIGEKTK